VDVLFVVGAVGFLSQAFRGAPSEPMVGGSLVLMGLPVVTRFEARDDRPPRDPTEGE